MEKKIFVLVILTFLSLQSSKYRENPTELKYQGSGIDRLENCIDFPLREIEFFFWLNCHFTTLQGMGEMHFWEILALQLASLMKTLYLPVQLW